MILKSVYNILKLVNNKLFSQRKYFKQHQRKFQPKIFRLSEANLIYWSTGKTA